MTQLDHITLPQSTTNRDCMLWMQEAKRLEAENAALRAQVDEAQWNLGECRYLLDWAAPGWRAVTEDIPPYGETVIGEAQNGAITLVTRKVNQAAGYYWSAPLGIYTRDAIRRYLPLPPRQTAPSPQEAPAP